MSRDSRVGRLLHFGSLYFVQGAILSYFLTFNVLYLRQYDLGADEIGVFQALLVLPFVLKILLGLFSDRVNLFGLGHRYPYILFGLIVQTLAVSLLPMVSLPGELGMYFVFSLAAAVGMALYDTCTDGLAVEVTPAEERGLVQGVMVGARAGGILIALLLGGYLVDQTGWTTVFLMVALMAVPALFITFMRWGIGEQVIEAGFDWSVFRALLRSDVLLLALIGCGYAIALDGVLSYLSYHDAAGGLKDIGLISGLVALSMVGRIIGATIAGGITVRLGEQASLRLAIALSVFACLGLSLQAGTWMLAFSCLVFGLAYGFFTTVYSAGAMRLSDPRIAASMFAVFMLFLNLGVALGQALGGWITATFGFQWLALLMAVWVFGLLWPVHRRLT